MRDDLRALLDYELWASRLLLASLAPLSHDDYVREVPAGAPSIRARANCHGGGACSIGPRIYYRLQKYTPLVRGNHCPIMALHGQWKWRYAKVGFGAGKGRKWSMEARMPPETKPGSQ